MSVPAADMACICTPFPPMATHLVCTGGGNLESHQPALNPDAGLEQMDLLLAPRRDGRSPGVMSQPEAQQCQLDGERLMGQPEVVDGLSSLPLGPAGQDELNGLLVGLRKQQWQQSWPRAMGAQRPSGNPGQGSFRDGRSAVGCHGTCATCRRHKRGIRVSLLLRKLNQGLRPKTGESDDPEALQQRGGGVHPGTRQ